MRSAYAAERRERAPARRRVLVQLEQSEIQQIDAWAVPTGQASRSDAIRALIKRGLEAAAS